MFSSHIFIHVTIVKFPIINLKGQYHAIFSNTLKIERCYLVDSSQDIMTKIPLKDYQNVKKLSTDVFAGRRPRLVSLYFGSTFHLRITINISFSISDLEIN